MKTVIYLDVLLLVNFLIAYFLLRAAGLLAGCKARFGRLLAGAGLSALTALILFAPPLPYAAQLAYKLSTAAFIAAAAFGVRHWRQWLAAALWYAAFNLLLAGFVLLFIRQTGTQTAHTANLTVYLRVSPLLLVALAALCSAASGLVLRLLHRPQTDTAIHGLEMDLNGTPLRVRAALDTGCHLRDPLTCLPVVLVSYPDAHARLPAAMDAFLQAWFAGQQKSGPPAGARLRLIPCTTAAGRALLPGFAIDDVLLITARGTRRLGPAAVAFSPQSLGGDTYEALYGAELLPLHSRS